MKHQQVTVDYVKMFKTSCMYLVLAVGGYLLIKIIQTVFWLPRYLERNQRRLEQLAKKYEDKMNEEDKNKVLDKGDDVNTIKDDENWKEEMKKDEQKNSGEVQQEELQFLKETLQTDQVEGKKDK